VELEPLLTRCEVTTQADLTPPGSRRPYGGTLKVVVVVVVMVVVVVVVGSGSGGRRRRKEGERRVSRALPIFYFFYFLIFFMKTYDGAILLLPMRVTVRVTVPCMCVTVVRNGW